MVKSENGWSEPKEAPPMPKDQAYWRGLLDTVVGAALDWIEQEEFDEDSDVSLMDSDGSFEVTLHVAHADMRYSVIEVTCSYGDGTASTRLAIDDFEDRSTEQVIGRVALAMNRVVNAVGKACSW